MLANASEKGTEKAMTPKDRTTKALEDRKKIYGSGYSIVEEVEDPSEKTGIKKVGR